MKVSYFESILLAGLLGCCSGARAGNPAACRPSILPVQKAVQVAEVNGQVEYAYDGTGWRLLTSGKRLRAGAAVRAGAHSSAVLRVSERSSLLKVSPETTLHITLQPPPEELLASAYQSTGN